MMTVGVNSANQSVKIPIGEVINEEISKVKRAYGYSRIDALTVESSADDVATALIAENENKRTMPNVGDVLVDWGGVTRVPVVKQTVQTGGEKPIYSFSFRTADNTATKTVKIQGFLYEPQTVVSVETVKDVTQQQISTLDTQLAEEATARLTQDDVLEAKITEEKNARIAKDDVIFTVTKDTINDAETVGDANWAWALTPSVSDEELNARIAKRANFYVDVSLDTLGFLPYLKYIKLESIPENKDGVFSALIPPASEFGYVETTNIKVKYNAKHKRWIALFYGADYIIPTATDKKNGLMSKSDKATLDALPTQLTAEQTARVQADKTLQTNIDALKATATADANGLMSKEDKAKFDEMKTITPYAEDLQSYGIEIPKPSVATSKVRRIGNMEMHRTLPIQSKMRGCLLDDDGNVVEYLPDNDWTTAVRDGSKGQVMVELPEHWERFYINEQGLQCVRISELNLPGYFFVPKMFISAYNASLQRSTNRLCSVVNKDVDYRGGNNLAEYDGQYNSLLGMPVTAVSRGKFREYARNRNAGKTTEWNCYLYEAYRILTWFYIIEYADRNVQQAFNAEKTPEGFAQGGLGEAIAIGYSDWGTYNKYNPFIPCGYTDEFGNRSGAKQLTISDNADFTHTRWVPRYRGVESFFADLWLWCDGVNIKVSPTVENGGDNTSKVYVCKDKSKFNETNYDGYEYLCDEARETGIVTDIHFGKRGDIIVTVVGGKSYADNYCDYHYVNTENKEEALRGLLLGGSVNYGTRAGLAFSNSGDTPAVAGSHFGSRLCFSPASANHDTNPI